MAARYIGFLAIGEAAVPVGRFEVHESYNRGWTAKVAVFAVGDTQLTLGSMVGNALSAGIVPGRAVVARLAYVPDGEEDESAALVRSWPGIISNVEPLDPRGTHARIYCLVTIVDVVSYFRDQTIWGCYRAAPAAEMIGGALSLATGTFGKPTLHPIVRIHPDITVVPQLRDSLKWIPYAIAAGQTLGNWLDAFCGLLGIRIEMLGKADGTLSIILADSIPRGDPLNMSLPPDETVASGGSEEIGEHGEISIANLWARRGVHRRSVVLDDPTQGQIRRVGEGPVGTLVTGIEVGLDEAYRRAEQQLLATASQLLVLTVESRQPGLRPGRRVTLDRSVRGIRTWQFHSVSHSLRGDVYTNRAYMLNGGYAWYPPRPQRTAPVVVPANVDGGKKFIAGEPVPRDKLGRIPVRFPFLPIDVEAEALKQFDVTRDGRVNIYDFLDEHQWIQQKELEEENPEEAQRQKDQIQAYLATLPPEYHWMFQVDYPEENETAEHLRDTEAREADVVTLRRGGFDDPFPGRSNDDLTDEELEERRELETKRTETYRYIAYKRALAKMAGDHDADDQLTLRDEAMSEELRKRLNLDVKTQRYHKEVQRAVNGGWAKDDPVMQEYLALFGDGPAPDWETHVARLDGKAADQKSPARVPLSILQPMAGGLHGFVAAHRQGDPCRVAVHDPLWAEIVGFEYRRHASMTSGTQNATAGVVVEHDRRSSWSGMLFRPVAKGE